MAAPDDGDVSPTNAAAAVPSTNGGPVAARRSSWLAGGNGDAPTGLRAEIAAFSPPLTREERALDSFEPRNDPPQDGARSAKRAPPRLLTAQDLAKLPPPRFLIRDFLRERGFNVVFGPASVGKSFLVLDWSLCVAMGLPWHGQQTLSGPVVYIAAEGAGGLHQRVRAWQLARGVEEIENIYWYPEPINFFRGEDGALRARLDELPESPSLIVVDTMARCMVGGEENSAKDVGLFIDNVEQLGDDYSAASLAVHHTGKSGEAERGSSALRGAADTMVALKPDGAGMRLSCEKQKDAVEFKPWRLHLVESGPSCVMEVPDGFGTYFDEMGPAEVQLLEEVPKAFGTSWTSATQIQEASELPKTSFYRARNGLLQRGLLEVEAPTKTRRNYRITEAGMAMVPSGPN